MYYMITKMLKISVGCIDEDSWKCNRQDILTLFLWKVSQKMKKKQIFQLYSVWYTMEIVIGKPSKSWSLLKIRSVLISPVEEVVVYRKS